MKQKTILILFIIMATSLFAEDAKTQVTKMDVFASKTGAIIKFIDYSLPDLQVSYSLAETKVRKLISGDSIGYFYQISYEGKYDTKTASIAYEDLLEVIKALQKLKTETANDLSSKPDYLENKFVTEDGFQLGYFVSEGKLSWYLVLEKYGSGNTVFINDVAIIEKAFSEAKEKIESIKK